MTSRQRLLTALRCQQPDRVPISIFINPFDPQDPVNSDASYNDLMGACREYADTTWSFGAPLGFLLTAHPVETSSRELPGGDVEHRVETPRGPLTAIYRQGSRGELKRFLTEPEDIEKWLSLPYVPPVVDHEPVRAVQEQWGEQVATEVVMMDPACCTGWIDEESVAVWTLTERELLRTYYDECFRRLLDQLRQVCEGPADIIYFNGPEYCLPPLMSPRDFEEFVYEYDLLLFGYIREHSDKLALVHSHGKVKQFLTAFRDMGVHGLNVLEPPQMGDVDLAEAKELIGRDVCLIGNLQYDDLARASVPQVRAMVREAMDKAKPGGGYILCPCARPYEHPIPEQTSRNLIEMLRAGREYGEY